MPSTIHFVPDTVTSGDDVLTRRETGSRQSLIGVTGKSINRMRTGRFADSIHGAASAVGNAVIIACTLVIPYDAASAANAWNAFTCAARSGIIDRRWRRV